MQDAPEMLTLSIQLTATLPVSGGESSIFEDIEHLLVPATGVLKGLSENLMMTFVKVASLSTV